MRKEEIFYIDMIKVINDIYKINNKDYGKSLEYITKLNKNNEMIEELINILNYIEKVYISVDKKIKDITKYDKNIIIKIGLDNYEKNIEIYKKIYKDNLIDIEILSLIIFPSISIIIEDCYEIFDFNITSVFNNRILNIINDKNFNIEECSICFEKMKNMIIISNCCCNRTCFNCYMKNFGKCAICKDEKPIIIKK